jgi:hypothetical protein
MLNYSSTNDLPRYDARRGDERSNIHYVEVFILSNKHPMSART